jgi:hypothetical protein
MINHDPELPAGFQDADLEMAGFMESARHFNALRKRGICLHGWIQGPPGPPGNPCNDWKCKDCGKSWATEKELWIAQEEAKEAAL